MKKYQIPTGYLIVDNYSKAELETLSIGDYGKAANIKADFLGFTKEINGVPSGNCKPLSEKWVITLSTQYGCSQKCKFCSVPNIPFRGNVSFGDLQKQFYNAIACFPNVKYTDRLNVHYARTGEGIMNDDVFEFSYWLYNQKGAEIFAKTGLRIETLHPVLTTSLPKRYKKLNGKIHEWASIKNFVFNGQAGFQFSINSTNEDQRQDMFNGGSLELVEFAKIAESMVFPIGRKYCLNFAYSSDFEIDAKKLKSLFDTEKFMVKITPIHENKECRKKGYKTIDGYNNFAPYKKVEEELKEAGFDTLVFVPSFDEEKGLVTCGNAILGGDKLTAENQLKIEGLNGH